MMQAITMFNPAETVANQHGTWSGKGPRNLEGSDLFAALLEGKTLADKDLGEEGFPWLGAELGLPIPLPLTQMPEVTEGSGLPQADWQTGRGNVSPFFNGAAGVVDTDASNQDVEIPDWFRQFMTNGSRQAQANAEGNAEIPGAHETTPEVLAAVNTGPRAAGGEPMHAGLKIRRSPDGSFLSQMQTVANQGKIPITSTLAVAEEVAGQSAIQDGIQGQGSISDQRFAQLLNPRGPQQEPLHGQVREQSQGPGLEGQMAFQDTVNGQDSHRTQVSPLSSQAGENRLPDAKSEVPVLGGHPQAMEPHRLEHPQEPHVPLASIRLPGGEQVPEKQVLDQVLVKLTGSADGTSGKAVLSLHPAELGEIKLDISFESDKLRAHLHAQSTQVQEILEKHLPRLRDSLAQQGLQVDSLQVSVDSGDRGADSWGHRQFDREPGSFRFQQARSDNPEVQPQPVVQASSAAMSGAGRGVNLRI